MRRWSILSLLLALTTFCFAQQLEIFEELTDTKPHDGPEVWAQIGAPVRLGWGSVDVRYKKLDVPDVQPSNRMHLKAWRGERVHAQAVLWTRQDLKKVSVRVSDLKNGSAVIPASKVSTHFVRYVMTDELNPDGSGGCGYRENKAEWDSSLVADMLDITEEMDLRANSTRPIWVKVNVPSDARPGKYRGTLTVSAAGLKDLALPLEVQVVNRTLPAPKDWAFNLDLWQNPYAVARYYNVPLWSKEHFDLMRPIMKMLADVGQDAITASIMHKPWNGQTEDHYDSMVGRIKKLDGTWSYDYTVFDRWVTFMREDIGIDGIISCYTMIPWAMRFDYYDQATSRIQFVEAQPDEQAYKDYWLPFLKDFSRHLREKGWFGQTAISMDERPMKAMQGAIKIIREADPEFKITLAGNYHAEIVDDLYYLAIPYGHEFPADVKARREKNGQLSCVYTCCTETFPNIFTFSDPAEAAWMPIHAVAGGYDGFLRWSINSWTADPLRDSRFRTWAAGDTYSIYPGPRSCIRFERLMEGLQSCEKIYMLRQELAAKGAKSKLAKLDRVLAKFTPEGMKSGKQTTAEMVRELNALLNSL
ncbi:MAG TPA: DUF4091 domain-containing protein [Candidatus Bacteroides merdigallinarum]|uniref:DUF4091 domain-containing protein n=1 Tax=Candidatus Bacteroides merdigallinarum TaxID=2838473 RepID=A0A9D2EA95_9BACE|nr:DUF4091 domain-containing protein [Candidatus Bacteroides merdigallinarum]